MAGDWIECEGGVAGSGARFGFQRRRGGEQVGCRVDGVDVDKVGAEVGDEDVLPCRVEDGFVRVRRVLAVGDGARAGRGCK